MRRSRKETDLAASSDLSLLGVMRLPDGDRYRRMRVVEVEGKRERRRGISGFVLRERLAASFRVRLFRQLPILNAQVLDSVPHYNLFDRKLGINIIRSALTKPARTIAENAGEEGSVVVGELLSKHGENFNVGFHAATGEYQDMIKAGVLDPLKIVKGSLRNASGVASLLFTTEACVVDAPEEKGPAGGMPGGMPGMGGMGGF